MKQLDRLLLRSFVGPFLVAWAIALFAFLMQYLWVYIDEIIGKGAGLLLIAELVGYLSVSLMPMALPVAVLIASVMTMGTFAEHYELAAMKSAGVPLLRVMAPLMVAGLAITAFSFACSNYLIPVANLQARTRLYDIRKQKPSLSLEEGVFNDDFQGFAIRIGSKGEDDRNLSDVMLYRQGGTLRGRIEAVAAERGVMQVTPDDRYFLLELADGYQYQEPEPGTAGSGSRTHPFVRTRFATYRKSFDLGEFDIEQTDASAFSDHHAMLSVSQLAVAADSIRGAIAARRQRLGIEAGRFFHPLKQADRFVQDSLDQLERDSARLAADLEFAARAESGELDSVPASPQPVANEMVAADRAAAEDARRDEAFFRSIDRRRFNVPAGERPAEAALEPLVPLADEEADYLTYFAAQPPYKLTGYIDRAEQSARTIKSYAEGADRRLRAQREKLAQHVYERHSKWCFALSCFILLFIGAPMGAIIRKGGFGYPMLVSIMFFTIFIILSIMGKKLAQSLAMDAALAAWLPALVIFPIGVALTFTAMNDLKFSVAETLGRSRAYLWLRARLSPKHWSTSTSAAA